MAKHEDVAAGFGIRRLTALRILVLVLLQRVSKAPHVCAASAVHSVTVPTPHVAAEAADNPGKAAAEAAASAVAATVLADSASGPAKDAAVGQTALSTGTSPQAGEATRAQLGNPEARRTKAPTGVKGAKKKGAGKNRAVVRGAQKRGARSREAGKGKGGARTAAGTGAGNTPVTAAAGGGTSESAAAETEAAKANIILNSSTEQGTTKAALGATEAGTATASATAPLSPVTGALPGPGVTQKLDLTSPPGTLPAGIHLLGAARTLGGASPLSSLSATAGSGLARLTASPLSLGELRSFTPSRACALHRMAGGVGKEREAAAAVARPEKGSSQSPSSTEPFTEDSLGVETSIAELAAAQDSVPETSTSGPPGAEDDIPYSSPNLRGGPLSLPISSKSPSSTSAAQAPDGGSAAQTASFAAALMGGTIRRLAFERCDRYTQKVAIAASPGDTIIAECRGAVRTIPTDSDNFCCRGSSGRCTTTSAVSYDAVFRTSSLPNFRYATGDGYRTPWKLKIPESLQPPYPIFSVAWLGPTALDIPIEAGSGATGVPASTLVVYVEAPRTLHDRVAVLGFPEAAGKGLPDDPAENQVPAEDGSADDKNVPEDGGPYEKTPFGLHRVSGGAATTGFRCSLRFTATADGGRLTKLPSLAEFLRCVPWDVVLSVGVSGSITFWP